METNDNCNKVQYCIEGYDPLPVLFRDTTRIRSFETAYWHYDFGDSIYYGGPTTELTGEFELPDDNALLSSSAWENKITGFGASNRVIMSQSAGGDYGMYFSNHPQGKHYTGIAFSAGSANLSGNNGTAVYPYFCSSVNASDTCSSYRFVREPNDIGKFVSISGISGNVYKDICNHDKCDDSINYGNDVMHIYKGPGLYLATMQCSSKTGVPSMALDEGAFVSGTDEFVYDCLVFVKPVCPCIKNFEVYGTETGKKFATITDPNFSIDNASSISSCTGYVTADSDGVVVGYAPYMKVAASGVVVPRSLPVTGAVFDWSDYVTRFDCSEEIHEFGVVSSGWPSWGTTHSTTASGTHVYTLPGIYSVGMYPLFDDDRIKKYMPNVFGYEECRDHVLSSYGSACCVKVLEIPPRSPQILIGGEISSYPNIVSGIRMSAVAGSYPISRIDYDFGDGSDIVSISKDAYCSFVNGEIQYYFNSENTSGEYLSEHTSGNGYFDIPPATDTVYSTFDPRYVSLSHAYSRTDASDGHDGGYVIRASAFAENTNTMVTTSLSVLTGGASLPALTSIEGGIELVDISVDENDTVQMVLNSEKENRTFINAVNSEVL